ncbi:acyl-CoA dehydrogenase family protein [Brevibacillus dissolubilis]|uniref:acyl-CoA dehydrogenase family protein n=1 Tax=Brevibacillus dissolubilis TaxID=1844116 RepID=UPI00111718B3|nr:acyl-CoA dehydrogenase family protein [Brevibacillus dissolubilis]
MRNIQGEINSRTYGDNIPHPRNPLHDNFYTADPNLSYLIGRYLDPSLQEWAKQELEAFGARVAGPIDQRAAYTDSGEGKPKLRKYNRLGEDISEIVTNEGYRQTVAEVYGAGIVGHLYNPVPQLGRTVPYMYSYFMGYLLSQSEPGFYCPVTLTMSAAYLLHRYGNHQQKSDYLTGLTSLDYATLYEGATWLTERQGGSDVGANQTIAEKVEGQENVYRLTGEKFFASNAGAMVATVMARVDASKPGTKGLGLFLVPWIKPDGEKNSISVRRLKEKLGVNAVPSAEVILEGAEGYLIGEPDKGFKYMAEALNISRICNAIASIGMMRRAFYEAKYYADSRKAFGSTISDYPMVREMMISLLVDLEVSNAAVFSMIEYFDKVYTYENAGEQDRLMARLLIPLLKYRTGEEAVEAAHTAIEIHGGNGFIEEYVTPRLLRDAQVTTVWEGTSNILALDLLRVMEKENGHLVFMEVAAERVSRLTHPLSQPFAARLSEELTLLRDNLIYLTKREEMYLNYKLKAIADHMVDIYSLLCIVEEAQDQVNCDGNARKYLLAQLYWKKHFAVDVHRGIRDDLLVDVLFFEPLVEYQPVSVESVAAYVGNPAGEKQGSV